MAHVSRCPESLYPVPAFSEIGVYMRLITSPLARSHCQALSKRIHYGKFVAESKFLSQTEKYTRLIRAHDSEGLMAAITDAVVEAKVRSCMDCRVPGVPCAANGFPYLAVTRGLRKPVTATCAPVQMNFTTLHLTGHPAGCAKGCHFRTGCGCCRRRDCGHGLRGGGAECQGATTGGRAAVQGLGHASHQEG